MVETVAMSRKAEILLLTEYLVLVIAGLIGTVRHPEAIERAVGPFWTGMWSIYVVVGAVFCGAGVLRDHWFGEFLGLPLVGSAMTLYAAAVLFDTRIDPFKTVGGILLIVFVSQMARRQLDVVAVMRAQTRLARSRARR